MLCDSQGVGLGAAHLFLGGLFVPESSASHISFFPSLLVFDFNLCFPVRSS